MKYTPPIPNFSGIKQLTDINLREIVPFINWKYFFQAWKLAGNYAGIETVCECDSCKTAWLSKFPEGQRDKAREAFSLFRDAQELLRKFLDEKLIQLNAVFGIFPASSDGKNITIKMEDKEFIIPVLRQQQASIDGYCYSLADFIHPRHDYIGLFANTVQGTEKVVADCERQDDMYHAILVKTLADRLAEATSEWLHFQVRKTYWGYSPDEELNVSTILKNNYQGIRPAVGYPSLPDQSIIFELNDILQLDKIGISLTENGAMKPNSSICGLYFSHPNAKYFMIGKIGDEQLSDYSARRGKSEKEMRKWLSNNL